MQDFCPQRVWPPRYPLPELEPAITRGVTAFRGRASALPGACLISLPVKPLSGPEEDGYPLLEAPFTVDVISLAAYNANRRAGGQPEDFEAGLLGVALIVLLARTDTTFLAVLV